MKFQKLVSLLNENSTIEILNTLRRNFPDLFPPEVHIFTNPEWYSAYKDCVQTAFVNLLKKYNVQNTIDVTVLNKTKNLYELMVALKIAFTGVDENADLEFTKLLIQEMKRKNRETSFGNLGYSKRDTEGLDSI
jgi:hypothetical protein